MISEPVIILPYDPEWARMFEVEEAALRRALDGLDVLIEHVGSTSVPGLAAKPIIDLMIVTRDEADAIRCITPIVKLGYTCLGEMEVPGRIYFRRGSPQTEHIHLYLRGNPEIAWHLNFRDALRADPAKAQAYAELKHILAEQFREDRVAYTEAKSDFVKKYRETPVAE